MTQEDPLKQINHALPADCTWTDINCHYCHRCDRPLAVFEFVRSRTDVLVIETCRRHEPKAAAVQIAQCLGIPMFKVAYTTPSFAPAVLMQVGYPQIVLLNRDLLVEIIDQLHNCEICGYKN